MFIKTATNNGAISKPGSKLLGGNIQGGNLSLYPTAGLQVIVYNQTYEEEGTTYLRTSIGVGIPKVSGTGLDTIWDFSVLNDDRFDKSNATYWGATLGDWFYYNELNPFHGKMKDFHYRELENQIESESNTIFAKLIYEDEVLQSVDRILVYENALTGSDLSKATTYSNLIIYNSNYYYKESWSSYWAARVPEYWAVYESMSNKPTKEIAEAQAIMVESLVNSGVWSKLDIFYLFAQYSNDDGEALTNWINPGTYDCTEVDNGGSLIFTSLQGLKGDGSAYLRTNWNPNTNGDNYTQNSACMGVYARALDLSDWDMGCSSGGDNTSFVSLQNGALYYRIYVNSNYKTISIDPREAGLKVHDRADANNLYGYINGIKYTPVTLASAGIPDAECYIFCINNAGAVGFSTRELSCAFAGASLTQSEHTDLFNVIENYLDT
jgi:hypothetical protein